MSRHDSLYPTFSFFHSQLHESKQPCSQLCEQKANIREKQKNITLVQFTVVQKGYRNWDSICLFDLGFDILFLISRKQKYKCSQLCKQKTNIREKQKNITLLQFTVVHKGYRKLDSICMFDLGFGIFFFDFKETRY